jgi:cell shape-determining protein MreC
MFSSSLDILHLVLTICSLALTFFLCWSLYYFISSAQKVHKLIKRVESGVTKVEEVISLVNEKVKSGSAYLMVLTEIAKQAMEYAKKRSAGSQEKTSSRSSRKK